MWTEIYLVLFILICGGLLSWGMLRKDRIYQYPFFMGGIFVAFLLPQIISLSYNPFPLNQRALEIAFLMSCLCAAMCWLGYQFPVNRDFIKWLDISVDPKRLLYGGVFFTTTGYAFFLLISRLPEEVKQGPWTGVITIYDFFSGLMFPGFAIILLSTLKRPTTVKLILTAVAAAIPTLVIFLYGRRESAATFVLTIALSLYFARRYLPPRWLAVAFIGVALFGIPLAGEYRGAANSAATAGEWSQLLALNPITTFQDFVQKGDYLELRGAAALMEATFDLGQYEFGAGYWNGLVSQLIPAQFLGSGFKYGLLIQPGQYEIQNAVNYVNPNGLTITGIADSFVQFDYFGCLFFFGIAYLFKNFWASATSRNSVISQLLYISLLFPAVKCLTHATGTFFPKVVFYLIFIGGLSLYARKKKLTGEIWR